MRRHSDEVDTTDARTAAPGEAMKRDTEIVRLVETPRNNVGVREGAHLGRLGVRGGGAHQHSGLLAAGVTRQRCVPPMAN